MNWAILLQCATYVVIVDAVTFKLPVHLVSRDLNQGDALQAENGLRHGNVALSRNSRMFRSRKTGTSAIGNPVRTGTVGPVENNQKYLGRIESLKTKSLLGLSSSMLVGIAYQE
jgi:hypothetical protein